MLWHVTNALDGSNGLHYRTPLHVILTSRPGYRPHISMILQINTGHVTSERVTMRGLPPSMCATRVEPGLESIGVRRDPRVVAAHRYRH